MAPEKHGLVLPVSIVGMVDLNRLLREIKSVQADLQAQALRHEDANAGTLPKLSLLLDEFVQTNQLNLLLKADQDRTIEFLEIIKNNAPKIHVSFSADPSPQFMEKFTAWFRENIHPAVLITVGLQPGIGAGCIVRTANKYFDFSLGKTFESKRELLIQQLHSTEVTA